MPWKLSKEHLLARPREFNISVIERLKKLQLFSLLRHKERYAIIYIRRSWRAGYLIQTSRNKPTQGGEGCVMWGPLLDSLAESGLYRTTVFPTEQKDSFNWIPAKLRNMSGVPPDTFKWHLDVWLAITTDQLPTPGYLISTPIVYYTKQWRPEGCLVTVETHLSCHWQNTSKVSKVKDQSRRDGHVPVTTVLLFTGSIPKHPCPLSGLGSRSQKPRLPLN